MANVVIYYIRCMILAVSDLEYKSSLIVLSPAVFRNALPLLPGIRNEGCMQEKEFPHDLQSTGAFQNCISPKEYTVILG